MSRTDEDSEDYDEEDEDEEADDEIDEQNTDMSAMEVITQTDLEADSYLSGIKTELFGQSDDAIYVDMGIRFERTFNVTNRLSNMNVN